MGRRRNTAKTGDAALYKSRTVSEEQASSEKNNSDDDGMYNEVDRYHNRKELTTDMLRFDEKERDESDQEDGLTNVEGVLDLGMGSSSDEDSSSDELDSDIDDSIVGNRTSDKSSLDSVHESDSSADLSDDNEEEYADPTKTNILNWGNRKRDYYHGDTADLEIGQEIEDAELEEEAGLEVLKARLDGMEEDDFMLEDDQDSCNDEEKIKKNEFKKNEIKDRQDMDATVLSSNRKNLQKLSKSDKIKLIQNSHPELLPLVQHFRDSEIRPCAEETLIVGNAFFQSKENAEVRNDLVSYSFCILTFYVSFDY